ncbi:endonuclease NucS [Arcanobacterium pinnipediorum]|uniref:Endonuclease NucS n=1 Tax=Arcanobacterium pinnipediorum TaxID=1503041 RepID=A0ABY5AKD9_9ACTO|nr:endonuclease NucS [Arcanobacterium pinnipediorum]USR79724.1 endonuclease NucS [Arcanobacterium pinnipediorum]
MRIVVARCSVDYSGRLDAHLEPATRVLMMKQDGSVLVHSDGGSYKPLNWMSPPATMSVVEVADLDREAGVVQTWSINHNKTNDVLRINIYEIFSDSTHDLGIEPGLVKDGVEAHLQKLLAEQVAVLGENLELVRREYPTAIGPVDLMLMDLNGGHVAVEVKRRGEIDGVEQLSRYLELLDRDSTLRPVRGIFAAQEIKPQARVLAEDRGIDCVILDYDAMRGVDHPEDRLF